MAIKTFTTGEVLTASDTNTYLANSGLVYVASKTWTTTGSGQQINDCFTSTYDNYMIVFDVIGNTTAPTGVNLKFCASGTPNSAGYYVNNVYQTLTTTVTGYAATSVSAGLWVLSVADLSSHGNINVYSPKKTTTTQTSGQYGGYGSVSSLNGSSQGFHISTGAFDGFIVTPDTGTWAGTMTVYGYRKA